MDVMVYLGNSQNDLKKMMLCKTKNQLLVDWLWAVAICTRMSQHWFNSRGHSQGAPYFSPKTMVSCKDIHKSTYRKCKKNWVSLTVLRTLFFLLSITSSFKAFKPTLRACFEGKGLRLLWDSMLHFYGQIWATSLTAHPSSQVYWWREFFLTHTHTQSGRGFHRLSALR